MSYNLFLDDVRMPEQCVGYVLSLGIRPDTYLKYNWVIVRNYREFVDYILENGLPERVSFDHDLAEIHYDPERFKETFTYYEESGYDCAKWLAEKCLDESKPLPEYYIHSMNPVGAKNIKHLLETYGKHLNYKL